MGRRRPRRVRIGIVGSRGYPDLPQVKQYVIDLYRQCNEKGIEIEFVSGGAHGVDEVAIDTAQEIGAKWKVISADWWVKKKAAGMIRNTEVVYYVDHLVAFFDGYSRGTADVVAKAEARGKLRRVFTSGETRQTRRAGKRVAL